MKGRKVGLNDLEKKEERRMQIREERLKNLWENLKHPNIQIMGMLEGEEKEQDTENLFGQIVKENIPKLVKEVDFQEVQEAQRVLKKLGPRRSTPRHIIIKMPKIKDKERILEAEGEKQIVTHKGVPIRLSADFLKQTLKARKDWQK